MEPDLIMVTLLWIRHFAALLVVLVLVGEVTSEDMNFFVSLRGHKDSTYESVRPGYGIKNIVIDNSGK